MKTSPTDGNSEHGPGFPPSREAGSSSLQSGRVGCVLGANQLTGGPQRASKTYSCWASRSISVRLSPRADDELEAADARARW